MTTTTWTSAPAGVLGQGSVDVRPYPGVVVCPTPDAVHGSGLPAGGFAAEVRDMTGDDTARLRPLSGSAALVTREPFAARFTAQKFIDQQSTQNDGTTLGIHSPGRPQS
jgi:hypothetical protein